MRLHSILLILYLLHVAAGAGSCEKTLAKGTDGEFVYDGGEGKELTCKNNKHIVIKGQPTQYVKLKCESDGWKKKDGSPFDPKKKPNEELKFECKAKAAECDASYIDGPNGKYDYSAKELKCKFNEIEIVVGDKSYEKLKCEAGGWKTLDGNLITPAKKADEDLNIKCEAKECSIKHIKGPSTGGVNEYDLSTSNELTCKGGKVIEIEGIPGVRHDKLTCVVADGWKDGSVNLSPPVKAKGELKIKCVTKPPPPLTKCIEGLIKGVDFQGPPPEAKFKSNKLTCTDTKNEIEFKDKLYSELTCDANSGWKYLSGAKLEDSDKEITVKCVAKACHKSLISGFDAQMTYDASKKLKCKKPFEELEYNKVGDGTKMKSKELTCDPADKWKSDGDTATAITAIDGIAVSCVVKACHSELVTDISTGGLVDKTVDKQLKCTGTDNVLQLEGGQETYDELKCDGAQWASPSALGQPVKTAIEEFKINCVPKPGPAPLCSTPVAAGSQFDIATKTLTCHPGDIDLNGGPTQYKSLKCDEANGWSEDGITSLAAADAVLTVTCKHYCEVTGADVEYKISEDKKYYDVTCKSGANEVNGLFYNDGTSGAVAKLVKVMTCSKDDGWTADTVSTGKPSNAPLALECRKGCDNIQKPTTSNPPQWEVGLTDSVETELANMMRKEVGYRWFECKDKKISLSGDSNKKNAIQLNEKFVHSHLRCSIAEGYTDFAGKSLVEDAYAQVKIDCVDSPCKQFGSPPTCKALEGSTPEGFICLDSAFTETDDPNQLNCKTKLHQLYDNEEKKLLGDYSPDKPLTCKEGVSKEEFPYGIWYKYGDAQETQIANVEKMVCLRMKCNACTKLATFPDTFTEGTHKECATVTCENNLWMIKKEGATNEEEYAGEVTCTTFEERTSDRLTWVSRWIIDADWKETKIAEGRCFAGPLTNCMESAKLETKCNSAWPGCTELTLSNDNPVTCPDGKMMYYKHKGVEDWKQFEEGAKSIKCDATKGVWTITPGEKALNRGDTVICGDSSNPITTTLAPTTLGPDPCDICKQGLKKCDTCEGEIDFKIDTETEKCTATMEGSVDGVLTCDASEKVWKDTNGKAVGQFTAKKKEEDANMGLIIGGAIGGAVVLFVVLFVIFKLVISRRKPKEDDKDEETKRRMLEEGKKRKKKRGDNDEILDEVSVDAPSELKL